MKRKAILSVCLLTVLLLSIGCQNKQEKIYFATDYIDGEDYSVILDPGKYEPLPYTTKAPDPTRTTITGVFLGQNYTAEYVKPLQVSYGNYYYVYETSDGRQFTVDYSGKIIKYKKTDELLDEGKITDMTADQIISKAYEYLTEAYGEDTVEKYEAVEPQITRAYTSVYFNLKPELKDNRFRYMDDISVGVLPDGSLFYIFATRINRFDEKKVPEYFTEEYALKKISDTINDDSVKINIDEDGMRLITVNNGTLACVVSATIEKEEKNN